MLLPHLPQPPEQAPGQSHETCYRGHACEGCTRRRWDRINLATLALAAIVLLATILGSGGVR